MAPPGISARTLVERRRHHPRQGAAAAISTASSVPTLPRGPRGRIAQPDALLQERGVRAGGDGAVASSPRRPGTRGAGSPAPSSRSRRACAARPLAFCPASTPRPLKVPFGRPARDDPASPASIRVVVSSICCRTASCAPRGAACRAPPGRRAAGRAVSRLRRDGARARSPASGATKTSKPSSPCTRCGPRSPERRSPSFGAAVEPHLLEVDRVRP